MKPNFPEDNSDHISWRTAAALGLVVALMILCAVLALYWRPQIPPPQDPEESMKDTILVSPAPAPLQNHWPVPTFKIPDSISDLDEQPDTIILHSGRVAVRPGHGNVPLYDITIKGICRQYYKDKEVGILASRDSSWTDNEGHQWRARGAHIVATRPRGFPFWVIWDSAGYSLTKWGKRSGGK